MSLAKPGPSSAHRDGIVKDAGLLHDWCAARRMATRRAVLLARPVSMLCSVNDRQLSSRAAYHNPHELDWMGIALRGLCRRHRPAGQGGRGACGLEPGHGAAHQRGGGLCLGHRAGAGQARRDPLPRPPHPALSRAQRAWPRACRGSATSAPCNWGRPRAWLRWTSSACRWSWSSPGCCWAKSSRPQPSPAACSSPPEPW